jgi:hypothetical protein
MSKQSPPRKDASVEWVGEVIGAIIGGFVGMLACQWVASRNITPTLDEFVGFGLWLGGIADTPPTGAYPSLMSARVLTIIVIAACALGEHAFEKTMRSQTRGSKPRLINGRIQNQRPVFATRRDLAKSDVDLIVRGFDDPTRLVVGEIDEEFVATPSLQSTVIVGEPGEGKTRRLLAPFVAAHQGPLVCVSTNFELAHVGLPMAIRQGRPAMLYSPTGEGADGAGWDAFAGCSDYAHALRVASALLEYKTAGPREVSSDGGSYFKSQARSAISLLLHAADLERSDTPDRNASETLHSWLAKGDYATPLSILQHASVSSGSVLVLDPIEKLAGIGGSDPKELGYLRSTVNALLLDWLADPRVRASMRHGISPRVFAELADEGRNPVLFIVQPGARDDKAVAPLLTAFMLLVHKELLRIVRANPEWDVMTHPLGACFLLEEMANLGGLPSDLDTLVTGDSRKSGIYWVCVLQDLEQVEAVLDQTKARVLVNTIPNLVVIGNTKNETVQKRIVRNAGKRIVARHSESDKSKSMSEQEVQAIEAELLENEQHGKIIYLHNRNTRLALLEPLTPSDEVSRLVDLRPFRYAEYRHYQPERVAT